MTELASNKMKNISYLIIDNLFGSNTNKRYNGGI